MYISVFISNKFHQSSFYRSQLLCCWIHQRPSVVKQHWIGDHLDTCGAADIDLSISSAYRQVDRVENGPPLNYVAVVF